MPGQKSPADLKLLKALEMIIGCSKHDAMGRHHFDYEQVETIKEAIAEWCNAPAFWPGQGGYGK